MRFLKSKDKPIGRPQVTMFMLMSADGKTSTGEDDCFDFDTDLPKIPSAKAGLKQYYNLEKKTALWTVSSGKTQHKVCSAQRGQSIATCPASIVVIDNRYIVQEDLQVLSARFKQVVIATAVRRRFMDLPGNVKVEEFLSNSRSLPLSLLVNTLYEKYGVRELCLQGGGTLNASFLRAGLVDTLDLVVAPIIVGGQLVPSVVSGRGPRDLLDIVELELTSARPLQNNYVRLRYKVCCRPTIT